MSGAAYTSKVFIKALNNALKN
ncbi:hypothetical protein [Cetobacterium somerae]